MQYIEFLKLLDFKEQTNVMNYANKYLDKEKYNGFLSLFNERSNEKKLNFLKEYINDKNCHDGIEELETIISNENIKNRKIIFDPYLVRGVDYYTGPIFEIQIPNSSVGSISGGGRYDNLIHSIAGIHVTATGMAIGLERLIDAINEI